MATAPAFLAIKNYRKHQHYHKRGAPWIKLYAAVLTDPVFIQMSEAAQAQLMKLWVLASQLGHPLPNNPRLLAGKIGTTGKFHLATLIDAGFLVPCDSSATEPLAEREQNASNVLAEDDADLRGHARADAHSRESTEVELRGESTETVIAPRVVLCAAANRGLAEHPTHAQLIPRILPNAGRSLEATRAILDAGVPLAFAESAIYEAAKTHVADDQINSLNYFVKPTLKAWREHMASEAVANGTAPTSIGRRSKPSASPGEDSYAAGRAAFEAAS